MKHCPHCKGPTQRWGKTAAGTTRFFCSSCHRTITRKKRKDVHIRHLRHELDLWLGGKDSLSEIALRYHQTRQTFWKKFHPFFKGLPFVPRIPQEPPMHTLIFDGTYVHGHTLCALIAIDEHDRVFWRFAPYESYASWYAFLKEFPEPKVVVMDGQKGLFRAATMLWPKVHIQRCQFHAIAFATEYLGRRPKDEPGQRMLKLLYELKHVDDAVKRDRWLMLYNLWERRWDHLFSARNESRGFTYPRLRSVRFIMRRVIPNLFTYIDFPGTPSTTNLVEGWVNSALAEALRRHRGLKEYEKKTLVSIILTHLVRAHKERKKGIDDPERW